MKNHLELFEGENLLFSSNGKWVYPLFDLEVFVLKKGLHPENLLLKDKIAGKAAAFLMCKIGFKKVHIGLLSKLGKEVFDSYDVTVTWDELTEKINCKTEVLLKNVLLADEAYKILKQRAGLFHGVGIECKNLCCGYNKNLVLNNINLNISEGDRLLVLGENGEGKTTFLKTLIGLNKKVSGEIIFKRKDTPLNLKRGQIGFLGQNNNNRTMPILVKELMDVTASLLGIKGDEKDYIIEVSLKRCGALNLFNRSYYELSGGERQRVNLSRLICQRSALFILDEPSTHLDKKSRNTLIELINDIHEKEMPTILIASHDDMFINDLGWKSLNIKNGSITNGSGN